MGTICCKTQNEEDRGSNSNILDEDYHCKTHALNQGPQFTSLSNNLQIYQFDTHVPINRGKVKKNQHTLIKEVSKEKSQESKSLKPTKTKEKPTSCQMLAIDHTSKSNLAVGSNHSIDTKEDGKVPQSVRSFEVLPRMASFKFQFTPANFRSEKKSLEERYVILELIGKGKFGKVRKIKDKITNELRALKILPKDLCQSPLEFSEEIKILQRLVFNFHIYN